MPDDKVSTKSAVNLGMMQNTSLVQGTGLETVCKRVGYLLFADLSCK